MKAIFQGWNVMRILRLVLSIAIIVQGIISKDVLFISLGVIFGGMAIANMGCPGNSCTINYRTNNPKRMDHE